MHLSSSFLAVALGLAGLFAPAMAHAASHTFACVDGSGSKAVAGAPAGLAGFSLRFGLNSGVYDDHKIKRVGVRGGSSTVTAIFADNDGNDRFCWDAWHETLPAGTRVFDTTAECNGTCDLPIEAPRAGEVFVLRGFEFDRARDDSNVRRLSVDPDPARRRVRVDFSANGTFAYTARIQYAYVPGTAVRGQFSAADTRYRDVEYFTLARETGRAVLQGFNFEFRNGDHYLGMFRIEPRASDFRIVYRDKNFDDDYAVSLDYAILR